MNKDTTNTSHVELGKLTDSEKLDMLTRFSAKILTMASEGTLSGEDAQELAYELGLLKQVEATGSCGESCICAQTSDFPVLCYRATFT